MVEKMNVEITRKVEMVEIKGKGGTVRETGNGEGVGELWERREIERFSVVHLNFCAMSQIQYHATVHVS